MYEVSITFIDQKNIELLNVVEVYTNDSNTIFRCVLKKSETGEADIFRDFLMHSIRDILVSKMP
jgi:hypothetical protein